MAGHNPQLTDGDYAALARFRHALRVFLRYTEEAARQQGLTPTQHQLLLAVRGWTGPAAPSVGELAEQLQLRPHSALELAQRAAAAGFVTLTTDPTDRRRHLVGLTDRGTGALAALYRTHRDELARFRRRMRDVLEELDD